MFDFRVINIDRIYTIFIYILVVSLDFKCNNNNSSIGILLVYFNFEQEQELKQTNKKRRSYNLLKNDFDFTVFASKSLSVEIFKSNTSFLYKIYGEFSDEAIYFNQLKHPIFPPLYY